MCRWLAYVGSPVLSYDALYTPAHALVDQSLHARLGAELLASVCQSLAGRTLWSTTRLHQCWPLVLAAALAADTLRTSSLTLLRRAHDATTIGFTRQEMAMIREAAKRDRALTLR
jgi:hypothetical protein